ncbi:hypothetical protein [Thalassotalea eurytherma]|uniref:STAS/SEC14 domain-containing protein n=1 Tax=Thalassotalea eurytherma TaxID=1144278 RepID=A0ABQ6H065_9GAMM|nr:hypothetical protein [Thalassotalea eurytherma]GLX81477.1 hypothetical protein theurythT_09290 [Thalassotalea eurytherma]
MNEHGDFHITFSNDVFYIKILGPWNLETFEHYNRDFNEHLNANICSSYSVFATLEGDSLMIPEVSEIFKMTVAQRIAKGLENVAFCLTKSACPNLFKHQIHEVYKGLNLSFKCFNDIEQAKSWLNEHQITLEDRLIARLL